MKKAFHLTILATSIIFVTTLFVNCAPSAKNQNEVAVEPQFHHSLENTLYYAPKQELMDVEMDMVVAEQATSYQQKSKRLINPIYPSAQPVMSEPAITIADNPTHRLKQTKDEPVSTFSVDVDTSSFSQIKQYLDNGQLPPKALVRTEEVINYFNYDYKTPSTINDPIALNANLIIHPFKENTHLLQLGLKAFEVPKNELPPMNLVLLIDVSGSMSNHDKLPLLIKGMDVLIDQLDENDTISIVTYAGRAAVLADGVSGDNKKQLHQTLNSLNSGGSTHGSAGIKQAYNLAKKHFIPKGVNRVVLATDGDFNVGLTGTDALKTFVNQQADDEVYLSAIGFGHSGYNDAIMEEISNAGEGNAYFVNDYNQARRIFSEKLPSMTMSVAADVKVQVEFNPDHVLEYRLIGYNNRRLNREDFNNDKIDAAEMGTGHNVTAIYEITLKGDTPNVDPLRYQTTTSKPYNAMTPETEIAFFKARFKKGLDQSSEKISLPILNHVNKRASNALVLATSAMQFAENLRDEQIQKSDYDVLLKWLAQIDNVNSEVADLKNMIHNAQSLHSQH